MNAPRSFVGLDIGGTNLKVHAFAASGETLVDEATPMCNPSTPAWRDEAGRLVGRVVRLCPAPVRLAVAAPGLPARDGLSIAHLPDRLPGIENLAWQDWLGLDAPVPVLNDAQAALLGETWRGAAQGAANVILLTLGTGVGGAAMADGRVLRGHLGRAGHFGHVSLDPWGAPDIARTPGSLESAIGECTLPVRSEGRYNSTRALVSAVAAGDAFARAVWQRSVQALAAGLVGLVNCFDPEVVVVGGGMAGAGDLLFVPLRAALDAWEWRPGGARVRIVPAALGDKAGALGAARHCQLYFSS